MNKNSLTLNKGLSLSQAQSVSNLCNQRANEIATELNGVNNYSKEIDVLTGIGTSKTHVIVVGKKLPNNVVELLKEKSKLHACQAFLMENMKAKELMMDETKHAGVDISELEVPEKPKLVHAEVNMLPNVKETWGWEQLTAAELNEYLEAEAFAAHIGRFIHEGGTLAKLRKELPTVEAIEWMVIKDGEKTPVIVKTHHDSKALLKVHEELAALHRKYEQKVNYFKAKVKNLVTKENARIANINGDAQVAAEATNNELQSTYDTAFKAYVEKVKTLRTEFEKERQAKVNEIANMRIEVAPRFQETIDVFLNQLLTDEQE